MEQEKRERLELVNKIIKEDTKYSSLPEAPNSSSFGEEDLDDDEQMMRLMGFGGFDSTKGKQVEDNQLTAAKGIAAASGKRVYRQYMNRKGGFNKPLAKIP